MGVFIELQDNLLEMRILLITAMAFLPAFVMGKEAASAVNFQPICDFHNREIQRLERNVEELVKDVVMESDLYSKLKNSSNICGVIGYLALPECATKEGLNVFDKLDDKCAENKTNGITKSLQKLLRLDTKPSGQVIFRSCKDIVVKQLLGQFEKMLGLISSLCDQSSLSTSTRRKRSSYGGGYYPGGYDPSTIWFQYLLCHEQKISCYFFTQGWNEKEFGQYYLYENVLDTDLHGLGHASSGTDDHLLTLLLLAGAGGSHQPYHAYPSYKKRRDVEDDKAIEDTDSTKVASAGRRRRETTSTTEASAGRRRRETTSTTEASGGRRRRRTADSESIE